MSTENTDNIDWELVNWVNIREKGLRQLCVGGALFLIGLFVVAGGLLFDRGETKEPAAVYRAVEEEQYVYAKIQYLTESFAYYEAMENMEFYLAFDYTGVPSVLCFHRDEIDAFQPYIDYLYSDGSGGMPEELTVTGYAEPFDEELIEYVLEAFNECLGAEIAAEDFAAYFGDYYVQIGGRKNTYHFMKVAAVLLLAGAFVLFLGASNYVSWRRFLRKISHSENIQAPVVEKDRSALFAALGALAGAVLGGTLWMVVGAIGFYNFWTGFLIIIFSYWGYGLVKPENGWPALLLSSVFSAAVVIPASYLEWTWLYYSGTNGGIYGYVPLSRVLRELPAYISAAGGWEDVKAEVLLGYASMLVGLFACIAAFFDYREDRALFHSGKKRR